MDTEFRTKREAINIEQVILTNKLPLVSGCRCPNCYGLTEKVRAKVEIHVYWMYPLFSYCPHCDLYFITESELKEVLNNANKRFPKGPNPFLIPDNIEIVQDEDSGVLFIPKEMIDKRLHNRKNLPGRNDGYYEPSDKEFEYILAQYPAPASRIAKLKSESILAKEGYNYALDREKRHNILNICVKKHGTYEVVKALNFNISMREHQTKGRERFALSIATWNSDINYVENLRNKQEKDSTSKFRDW